MLFPTHTARRRFRTSTWVLVLALLLATGVLFIERERRGAARRSAECHLLEQFELLHGPERTARFKEAAGPVAAFLGDSVSQGLYLTSPFVAPPYLIAKRLGWRPWVDAVGGSGFISEGACGSARLARRAQLALEKSPSFIVVQAGTNDVHADPDELRNEVAEIVRTLTREGNAQMLLIGPLRMPGSGANLVDKILRDAAAAADVRYVSLHDVDYDTLPDGSHPNDEGSREIAEAVVAQMLNDG